MQLFLDELLEFKKSTLEVLRGPLEDRKVSISRVNASVTYPCNFMFVASMNPCSCGFYGSKEKECTCSPQSIARYMNKISGPLLDRIDIQIEVPQLAYNDLIGAYIIFPFSSLLNVIFCTPLYIKDKSPIFGNVEGRITVTLS